MNNPRPSSPETGERLARVRQANTAPEIALRRILHARGLRYRVQIPLLKKPRRTADIVFTRNKVAVFVDGCFWHGCPEHATWPKSNAKFWKDKIEANRARDRDTDRRLKADGWRVMRIWEHEDPNSAADRVEQVLSTSHSSSKVL